MEDETNGALQTHEEVLVVDDVAPGVRQLRLNRPARLNAIDVDLAEALAKAVVASTSEGSRVLLIRGTGRAFSAGADLKERLGMTLDERRAHNRLINHALSAIAAAPMPTIALVNGLALGGGCELALACDIRIASDSATLGLTELSVGAIPGAGGTQRLPRLIGLGNALDLMLSAEPMPAARAHAMGLVQRVHSDDEVDERTLELAVSIASRSQRSTILLKQVVHAGLDLSLPEALALEAAAVRELFAAPEYTDGLTAFSEKRQRRSEAGTWATRSAAPKLKAT